MASESNGQTPRIQRNSGPFMMNSTDERRPQTMATKCMGRRAQPHSTQPPYRSSTPGLEMQGGSMPSSAIPSRSQTPGPLSTPGFGMQGASMPSSAGPSRSQTPGPIPSFPSRESPDLFPSLHLNTILPTKGVVPDHTTSLTFGGSPSKLTEASQEYMLSGSTRDCSPIRNPQDAQRKVVRLLSQLRSARAMQQQMALQYQSVLEENKYLKMQANTATDNIKHERKQLRYGIHRAVYNVVMDEVQGVVTGGGASEALASCKAEIEGLRAKLAESKEERNALRKELITYKKTAAPGSQKKQTEAAKMSFPTKDDSVSNSDSGLNSPMPSIEEHKSRKQEQLLTTKLKESHDREERLRVQVQQLKKQLHDLGALPRTIEVSPPASPRSTLNNKSQLENSKGSQNSSQQNDPVEQESLEKHQPHKRVESSRRSSKDGSNQYAEVDGPGSRNEHNTVRQLQLVEKGTTGTQTTLHFGLYSHLLEKLYQSFLASFNENHLSHWAYMELWAMKQEFDWQSARLVMSDANAAQLIQRNWRRRRLWDDGENMKGAHKSAFLMALEDKIQAEEGDANMEMQLQRMTEGYDHAFIEAGGVRGKSGRACLSDEHRVRANEIQKMVTQLKEARPWPDRQTHGFETMGLDYLLAEANKKNDKMKFEVERLAKLTGGQAQIGKVKSRGRARVKSKRKYGNDFSCLNDCMRASIFFPSVEQLYDALELIIRLEGSKGPNGELEFHDGDLRRDFYFLDIEDRVLNDVQGYRDVIMKVVVDGLVGELQLHLEPLLKAKKGIGHKIYETLRLSGEFLLESSIRGEARSVERLASMHNLSGDEARDKNGRSALHYCCYHGLESCVTLLASGSSEGMQERGRHKKVADVWRGDSTGEDGEFGCLPVELALEMGHIQVVRRILKFMKERPPTGKQRTLALRRFAENCILFWIDYAAGAHLIKKDQSMAKDASEEEEEKTEEEEDGEEEDFPENFDEVVEEEKHLPVFQQLLDNGTEERESWLRVGPLMLEVLQQCDEGRREEAGRSVAFIEERFRHAAKNGQTERVYAFLAMGVNHIGETGESDWTVLDLAIENRHVETATAIAEYLGFDVAADACRRPVSVTGSFSPCPSAHLYEAALQEDPLYARAALASRADPNDAGDKTRNGKTPLMVFAAAGDMEMCKLLVSCGSSTTCEDKSSCRASFYARACGHLELQQYLVRIEGGGDKKVKPRDLFTDVAFSGCAGALWRWVQDQTEQSRSANIAALLNQQANTPFKPSALLIATRIACHAEDSGQVHAKDPMGQVCRAMLLFKADPSIGDRDGETPLHTAARLERMDIYELLIQALETLHGGERVKVLLTKELVDNMDETPELIVREQELKKLGREFIDHERDARLKQFIFTFWCAWLKSYICAEWRGVLGMTGGLAKIKERFKERVEFVSKETEEDCEGAEILKDLEEQDPKLRASLTRASLTKDNL